MKLLIYYCKTCAQRDCITYWRRAVPIHMSIVQLFNHVKVNVHAF